MFLLNRTLISSYLEEDNGTLSISPFVDINLEHTFYYFRLGREVLHNGVAKILSKKNDEKHLVLEPNDFALIRTLETFTLSAKMFGILGQCRAMSDLGLQLLHSPFIDPKYNKQLEFGVKNLNIKSVTLEFGESKIGKVSFFDISDTYPIKIRANSEFAKKIL